MTIERDVTLTEARLAPPPLPDGIVRRTAVVNRLLGAAWTRYVAITAPPGYGKSIALAQWAAREARPVAWLTLDRCDNDPAVLLAHLATTLGRVADVDDAALAAASRAAEPPWRGGASLLGAALESVAEPVVLVLDDAHHVESAEAVELLTSFAEHLPRASQLVIAGRHVAIPVSRWRASHELFELHAADLALNRREAEALVRATGLRVTDAELCALCDACEGWAAGLYLASRSLVDAPAPRQGAAVSGADPFISEYLRDEQLAHLSAGDLRFLTRSSVLQPMSAALCDAAMGRNDSARTLARLEQANAFLSRPQGGTEIYRYHPLMRDLLRNELDRLEPGRAWKIAQRAAAWCDTHGHREEAIGYAFASGDLELGARLANTLTGAPANADSASALEPWLRPIADALLLDAYPMLAIRGAWLHALRGRPAAASRWAEAVERAPLDGPAPDGSTTIEAWADVLRGAMCRGGAEQVRMHAERALAGLAPLSACRPTALVVLAAGHALCGDDDRALAVLDDAIGSATSGDTVDACLVSLSQRALLRIARGDHDGAEHDVAEARGLLAAAPGPDGPEVTIVHAAAARLALLRGNSRDARAALEDAEPLRPLLTYALPWFAVGVQLELARAYLALGEAPAARSVLADVAEIERRRPDLGVLGLRAAQLRRDADLVAAAAADGWAATLTAAELRLLPLLSTHMTFREIGQQLFVSRNTVKTQAISVYRKLGASSRSEAIRRAGELGLLATTSSGAGFTPTG